MEKKTCVICEKVIRPAQQLLVCQCTKHVHRICTSMTQAEYRKLKKEERLDVWKCSLCEVSSSNDPTTSTTNPNITESLDMLENLAENVRPDKGNSETTSKTSNSSSQSKATNSGQVNRNSNQNTGKTNNKEGEIVETCSQRNDKTATQSKTVSRDSEIANSQSKTVSCGSEISNTQSKTVSSDSEIANSQSKTVSCGSEISNTQSKTVSSDSEIANSQSKTVSCGSEIANTQSKNVSSDSEIASTDQTDDPVDMDGSVICLDETVNENVDTGNRETDSGNDRVNLESRGTCGQNGDTMGAIESLSNTVGNNENTVSDTQACDIKVDILPSGCVKLQWTVDKKTIWNDFLFAKYTVKVTELDSGKCVYKRDDNIHLPAADGSVQKYVYVDLNKFYTFSVDYFKNTMKVLTLKSCRTFVCHPRQGQVAVTSDNVASSATSSHNTVTITSSHAPGIYTSSNVQQHVVTSSRLVAISTVQQPSVVPASSVVSCTVQPSMVSARPIASSTVQQPSVASSSMQQSKPVASSSVQQQTVASVPSSFQKQNVETNSRDWKYMCCNVHGYARETKKLPVVEMVPWPFHKVIKHLMPLKVLEAIGGYGQIRNRTHFFSLDAAERNLYNSKPRHVAEKLYQVILRFCIEDKSTYQTDDFPIGCVRVNSKWVPLQPVAIGCKTRSVGHPVDITSYTDLKGTNSVHVQWNHENNKNHCLTIEFVEKLTPDDLIKTLKTRQYQHPHHTRDLIRKQLKSDDGDNDLCTTNIKASLMCPIGKGRMTYPCVGSDCNHVQCVDAMTVLQMNENKAAWKCLICSKPIPFDKLRINGYFMEVLSNIKDDVTEVELDGEGNWKIPTPEKEKENDDAVDTLSESMTTIDLTESDNEENTPVSPVKLVNAPLSGKLVRGSDKVAPLGDNTGILNRASHLVDSVTSIVRSVIGTSYNQTTLTNTHRNNNHSRNHNQRPYERNWNGNRHHSSNWNRNSPRRNNRTNLPQRNFNSPRRNFNNRPYNNNARNWFDYNSSRGNTGYSSWNNHHSNGNNNYNQSGYRNYRTNSYNLNYNTYTSNY